MAAAIPIAWSDSNTAAIRTLSAPSPALVHPQPLDFSGVFHGHELTRKDRRLSSHIASIDALIGGGIARGRISEIIGRPGCGRTSLAASFAASATRRGEVAAWIDSSGAFDPSSLNAAGADLGRILWASFKDARRSPTPSADGAMPPARRRLSPLLRAAELVLEAGGFGLVVIDFGDAAYPLPQSAALRLARAAERSGAAVIAIAPRRMCGTFAAVSLVLRGTRARFSRGRPGAPALFDGLQITATLARNKLGGCGASTTLSASVDPLEQLEFRDPADAQARAR
jgi:recombination protein RecA